MKHTTISPDQFSLTREEQSLLPGEEDIRFYQQNGYYISAKVIPDEMLDAAIEASERYYRAQLDDGPSIPPSFLPNGGPYTGLRAHVYPSFRCRGISQLVHLPLVAATAARLARVNEIRLWRDQLLYKPAGMVPGTRVGWHRDRSYWKECTSNKMLTAWIPFTSITEEMGPMDMLRGSNHWRFEGEDAKNFFDQDLKKHEAVLTAQGYSMEPVPIVLDRGQVSFHSCLTFHSSSENTSDRPRQNLIVHLQDGDNRYQPQDGVERVTSHDLVRYDPQGRPDFSDPVYCPTLWRE